MQNEIKFDEVEVGDMITVHYKDGKEHSYSFVVMKLDHYYIEGVRCRVTRVGISKELRLYIKINTNSESVYRHVKLSRLQQEH